MSNDITTNLSFKVDNKQLKQAVEQLSRFQTRLQGITKDSSATSAAIRKATDNVALQTEKVSKLNGTFQQLAAATKQIKAAFASETSETNKASAAKTTLAKNVDRLSTKNKELTKALNEVKAAAEKDLKASQRLGKAKENLSSSTNAATKNIKEGGAEMGDADKKVKKLGSSLGFTGLAFGFIGGAAAFAGNQIKQAFMGILEETGSLLSEIDRIGLFSDIGIEDGAINIAGLETFKQKVIEVGRETGIELKEVATFMKEVEKAIPANVDSQLFVKEIANLKLLENTLDAGKITQSLATIQANFPDMPIDELNNYVFAFSKANKLAFGPGAQALAFASQNAKLFGADFKELATTMSAFINIVPGERGNAGRGLRRLLSAFSDPKALQSLKLMKAPVTDLNGNFIGLEAALDVVAKKFKHFNEKNQEMGAQFLTNIGLSENAKQVLLAYADASDELKASIAKQFELNGDELQMSADFMADSPEATFGKIKNSITELKLAFAAGVFKPLKDVSSAFQEAFGDTGLQDSIKQIGGAIGNLLAGASKVLIPIMKTVGAIFKDNIPLINAVAVAFVALTAALIGIGIVFPILGAFFALIFLHEKLSLRSKQLEEDASMVTKQYVKMADKIESVNKRISAFISRVGQAIKSTGRWIKKLAKDPAEAFKLLKEGLIKLGGKLVAFKKSAIEAASAIKKHFVGAIRNGVIPAMRAWGTFLKTIFLGFGSVLKAVAIRIGLWGFIGGLLFGQGFNGGAATGMGKGVWLRKALTLIGLQLVLGALVIGKAFATAFSTGASLIMGGLSWIKNILIRIGVLSGAAGLLTGTAWGGNWVAGAGTGMNKPGWIVSSMKWIAAQMVIAGGVIGGAFAGAWAFVVEKGTAMVNGIKTILIKLGLMSAGAGLVSGTVYGAGFHVTAPAGFKKPGLLARMFAPIIAASGISGATAGTIFGTAMMVAAAAAILIGVDMILESLTGMSFVREITKAIFGGEGTSAKDALGLNDINGVNTSGQGIFSGPNNYANYGKGGGTGRNANKGSSFFDSVNAKGMGGSSNSQVINNDVVISPTINFGSTEGLDEKQIVDMLNKEFGKFLEPKMGVIYR